MRARDTSLLVIKRKVGQSFLIQPEQEIKCEKCACVSVAKSAVIEVIVSEITPKIAKIVVIAPRRYPIVRGEKVHFAGSNVIEAEEEHA